MVVSNLASKIQRPTTNRERFFNELPWFARCSLNKGELVTQPRVSAQHYPYIQANRADMRSWMVFDLDHENAWIWQDANLPPPNMIVSNRNNGRSHLYYAVEPVYFGQNARQKPVNYFNAVYKRLRKLLDADPAFGHFISKTPYCDVFRTLDIHHQVYSLQELADYVDFEDSTWLQRRGRMLREDSLGRNCAIFDELRHYAYSVVDSFRAENNESGFYNELMSHAESANDFSDCANFDDVRPLSFNELQSIVKSVSKWTFANYVSGSGKKHIKRGVMMLFKQNLSLCDKQSKAASRTNAIRSKCASDAIISATWKYLAQNGTEPKKVCISSIANLANLSRQTVYKYRILIDEIIVKAQPVSIIPLSSLVNCQSVNYGSYQLLAPFGGVLCLTFSRIFQASIDPVSVVNVGILGWIVDLKGDTS
ncbi:replication protein A [Vibrio parahaemolyticus]|nr:replication protein A [Vibrio parahaemolyticus]